MDRSCHPGTARSAFWRDRAGERSRREDRQPLIRTFALLAVLAGGGGVVFACKVSTNLDQVVALEVVLPNGGQVGVGDTLLPSGPAPNGHGDTITTVSLCATLRHPL